MTTNKKEENIMKIKQIQKAIAQEFELLNDSSNKGYVEGFIDEYGLSAVIFYEKEHVNIFWDEHIKKANSELVIDK